MNLKSKICLYLKTEGVYTKATNLPNQEKSNNKIKEQIMESACERAEATKKEKTVQIVIVDGDKGKRVGWRRRRSGRQMKKEKKTWDDLGQRRRGRRV
jgi:hypothetical protein